MGIDAFLQELFPPSAGPPASFGDRFSAAADRPIDPARSAQEARDAAASSVQQSRAMPGLQGIKDMADTAMHGPGRDAYWGGEDDGALLPPGARPMSGRIGSGLPVGNMPMPRPRPNIEGILAGQGGGGGMPMPPPGGPPPGMPPQGGPPGMGGGPMEMLAQLAGRFGGGGPPGMQPPRGAAAESGGFMDRLAGPGAGKRMASALAGGFAGGNPAFKGGALMKGFGGGLTGGLKSDKEDLEADVAAENKAQTQANFERTATEREKTGTVQRDVLAARAKSIKSGKAPGSSMTERIINNLMERNPDMSYEDALARARKSPDVIAERRRTESLALSAAKADIGFQLDPEKTLQKWRKQYRLDDDPGPAAAPTPRAPQPPADRPDMMTPGNGQKPVAAAIPTRPPTVPPGAGYSPGTGMWFTRDGKRFGADGNPVAP